MARQTGLGPDGMRHTPVSEKPKKVKSLSKRTPTAAMGSMAEGLSEVIRPPPSRGGEGVLLLNSAPKGYWVSTICAVKRRPRPTWLSIFAYAAWVSGSVAFMVLYRDGKLLNHEENLWLDCLTFISAALFFLLVFRTNTAYDRWWEGRKLWGSTINRCRDMARQAAELFDEPAHIQLYVRHTIGFAVAMKRSLRGERKLEELEGVLDQEHIEEMQKADHMAVYQLDVLAEVLRSARLAGLIDSMQQVSMDANLTQLHDNLGACERILKTKMPFAYVVHLRAFLMIWLLFLPWGLAYDFEWTAIPAAIIIAYALFGLEVVAIEIENPFGHDYNDLPLDTLTDETIRKNLLGIEKRSVDGRVRKLVAGYLAAFPSKTEDGDEQEKTKLRPIPSSGSGSATDDTSTLPSERPANGSPTDAPSYDGPSPPLADLPYPVMRAEAS